MSAATWPTFSLSMPLTTMRVGLGDLERDAVGRVDHDGMAEAEGEAQRGRALGLGPVADADDLQLLAEAGRHADDHVVDEAAGEPVQAAVLPLVVGPLDEQRVAVLADGDGAGDGPGELPPGPFTVTVPPAIVTSTPLGTVIGALPMRLIVSLRHHT